MMFAIGLVVGAVAMLAALMVVTTVLDRRKARVIPPRATRRAAGQRGPATPRKAPRGRG